MANSNNPFNYPVFHQDQPSPVTYMQQPQPINNNYNPQPSFNQNYMQQPMPNPEDITDPTTAMNMALALMAKAFKLNYSNNQQQPENFIKPSLDSIAGQKRNWVIFLGTVQSDQGEVCCLSSDSFVDCSKGRSRNPTPTEEYLFDGCCSKILMKLRKSMQTALLMAQFASKHRTSGTTAKNNEIFNMITPEEPYTEILEPIPEPHQVQQNDNVISDISGVEQEGEQIRQHLLRPEGHSQGCNTKNDYGSLLRLRVVDMNSRGKKQKANVSNTENQKKQKPKVIKPKKVGSLGRVDLFKRKQFNKPFTPSISMKSSASPIIATEWVHGGNFYHSGYASTLSHLNFDTINDLAKNDLVTGLPKFKYHKEHLCPSCEQGKSKRASHPPKPVPNSKQRLHLLHMDLCVPHEIAAKMESDMFW
ncbi:hypothetical protein Tco_1136112 [Tanacetum coccineum]